MKLSKEFRLTFLFLLFLLIYFSGSVCSAAEDDSIDWSCVDLRFSGICICTSGRIGLGITVTFWLPEIYIETVKKPGDGQFSSKSAAVAQSNIPIYSGTTTSALHGSNLQFNEAHVMLNRKLAKKIIDLLKDSFGALECPEGTGNKDDYGLNYVSELDAVEWRFGVTEWLHTKTLQTVPLTAIPGFCAAIGATGTYAGEKYLTISQAQTPIDMAFNWARSLCMGYWGFTYPRRGFFTHQSEVVGSAADVWRALEICGMWKPGDRTHHVITKRLPYPVLMTDKIQMIRPAFSSCMFPGKNPALWDMKKTSKNGKYMWLFWKKYVCCYCVIYYGFGSD